MNTRKTVFSHLKLRSIYEASAKKRVHCTEVAVVALVAYRMFDCTYLRHLTCLQRVHAPFSPTVEML